MSTEMSELSQREEAAINRTRELLVAALEESLEEIDKDHSDGETPEIDDLEETAMIAASLSLIRMGSNDPRRILTQIGLGNA